jgi:tRNA nucleotidyltransferase (CCA-adding enzyme)
MVRVAVEHGAPPYLVGGPVRDLLLEEQVGDVDLLLAGKLQSVARESARAIGARLVLHSRFLTARLETPGLRIDLSRARRERYPTSGALPLVAPSTVGEDLGRRDFTIHAMALPLDRSGGSALLDPFQGRADLERRSIRILHDESFHDDPTRLLRAARYAARLGFRLSSRTRSQFGRAIADRVLDKVSGDRVLHEIARLLDETDPARAVQLLGRWNLLEAIVPGWSLGPATPSALRRFREAAGRGAPWPEAVRAEVRRACGLALLLLGAAPAVRTRALSRLAIQGRPAKEIATTLERLPRMRQRLARARRPSAIDTLLDGANEVCLLSLFCVVTGRSADAVRSYARDLRGIPAPLNGHAARSLGAVGVEIGDLLRAARHRVLDGGAVDEAWVRHWLAQRR